ncbi:pyridoxamine 5'-phosphate oxidase family protein [Luteimicrobium sp. NPDC057192]|uniref:pyridoxamine 5'-phosphate oxidase family protein n=1 Tax=Luteimicrobium sp. NPDC057192 TaxID=3346042 RepID=UPI00362A63C8
MRDVLSPAVLSEAESLELLASVPSGRLLYTARAMPSVVPARHALLGRVLVVVVDGDSQDAEVVRAVPGAVVAYEVEGAESDGQVSWYAVAVGLARFVHAATRPPLAAPALDAAPSCVRLEVRIDVLCARGRRTARGCGI